MISVVIFNSGIILVVHPNLLPHLHTHTCQMMICSFYLFGQLNNDFSKSTFDMCESVSVRVSVDVQQALSLILNKIK